MAGAIVVVTLALVFNRRLSPGLIEHNLDRLVEVRQLLPGCLFPESAPSS